MKIYSVSDPEFAEFGKVLKGYDTTELLAAMDKIEKDVAEKGYKVDRIWWEYFREEVPE